MSPVSGNMAPYNVPLIPPDLRQEEMMQQICDSLQYLEQISSDIFARISNRITDNRTQLAKLNGRIDTAQAKIDRIKGSNKATRVFSSAKYPSLDEECNYRSLFERNCGEFHQMKDTRHVIQSKVPNVDEKVLQDKRQFYNVHINQRNKVESSDDMSEGLGRLPHNIHSVSSLLLFNTSENLYKKYVTLDPLGVVTKTRKSIEDETNNLSEAPSTIKQREELMRFTTENYSYNPGIGTVPELAVPDRH
jgi:WAS family protein 1